MENRASLPPMVSFTLSCKGKIYPPKVQKTMIQESLLADLVTDQPGPVRLQKLVSTLKNYFACGAVVLLRRDEDTLTPVANHGLVKEAFGRHFELAKHPRLAMLCSARQAIRFEPDSPLPDPYDGLIEVQPGEQLAVHDCMGMPLFIEGDTWGVVTLDALIPGTFTEAHRVELQRCALVIEAMLRMTRLEQDNKALRQGRQDEAQMERKLQAEAGIIGQSVQLTSVLDELNVVADSELPVLLLGETGTGKELFARRLHALSPRAKKPMVYVNCAALPETLAESELFGHAKGAFSGAASERQGRFESADGGTIFLDEVGELPLNIQAKLLRVLQNGEVQRLGTDKTRHVDVRIVAATNRKLNEQVKTGEFRADLYHRLSVYPLHIPPLRDRGNDILLLAGFFLEQNRTRLGFRSLRIADTSESLLLNYPWPGNVRELEHVVSRAAIKALSRGVVRSDIVTLTPDCFDGLGTATASVIPAEVAVSESGKELPNLKQAVEQTQRSLIRQALHRTDQSWAQAARLLGIDASNLHKLAGRLGLKASSAKATEDS